MTEPRYRPWRTDDQQPSGLLDERVAMSWQKLVEESRQSIAGLTQLRADLDERMQSGAQMVQWLRSDTGNVDSDSSRDTVDAIERRLATLEQRLAQIEAALTHAGQSPARRATDPAGEPGEYILRRFRSKAA